MTKILLIEKRYDGTQNSPSVTAKWIEVPNGEEGNFLIEQIYSIEESSILKKEEAVNLKIENSDQESWLDSKSNSKYESKRKLSTENIETIIGLAILIMAFGTAVFLNYLITHSN